MGTPAIWHPSPYLPPFLMIRIHQVGSTKYFLSNKQKASDPSSKLNSYWSLPQCCIWPPKTVTWVMQCQYQQIHTCPTGYIPAAPLEGAGLQNPTLWSWVWSFSHSESIHLKFNKRKDSIFLMALEKDNHTLINVVLLFIPVYKKTKILCRDEIFLATVGLWPH